MENNTIRRLSVWKNCINEIPTQSNDVEFIIKQRNEGNIQYVQHLGYYSVYSESFVSYDDSERYLPITQCLKNDEEAYVCFWIDFDRSPPPNYIKVTKTNL